MFKLAFDVMGTDNGLECGVVATKQFLTSHDDVFISLVGNEPELEAMTKKYKLPSAKYNIVPAISTVEAKDGILSIRRKKNSSMSIALNLLKNDKSYNCVLSGGATTAFVAGCHFILGEIPMVKRSAYMVFIPTVVFNKFFILLDAGANVKNTAEDLLQYAAIANVYSQAIMGVDNPKIGLLNIGTEPTKGLNFHKEANILLKKAKNLNFVGNVEPRNLMLGEVDILVADGYSGNLILKSMEGSGINLFKFIKEELTKTTSRKLRALLLKGVFREIRNHFDYRNYAAAIVVGSTQLAIKAHGSADTLSLYAAIKLGYQSYQKKVNQKINASISRIYKQK